MVPTVHLPRLNLGPTPSRRYTLDEGWVSPSRPDVRTSLGNGNETLSELSPDCFHSGRGVRESLYYQSTKSDDERFYRQYVVLYTLY